jgi:hypothetical protein
VTDAIQIAEALRGLSTGDQDPPRPWAHLSHIGTMESVSRVRGGREHSSFTVTVDGQSFTVIVEKTL